MRILLVHNFYQSASPSGEDIVFDNEFHLLQQAGHEVFCYTRHNDDISSSVTDKVYAAASLFWSRKTHRELTRMIKEHRPDVAHFHNTFPLISASGYAACKDHGVPIVQTLHNYRLICPGALLLRDGKPCEDCIGNSMFPAIQHGCYRHSRSATALITGMLNLNRIRGTYAHMVDRYICLTGQARQRMIRGGLPASKLTVKANVLRNPPAAGTGNGGYALYVGRLTTEKGVSTLINAWRNIEYPLKIAGDGALRATLENAVRQSNTMIEFLGFRPREEILRLMQQAQLLIIPSECYEGFPVTVLEAFATGTPLLVSRIGALDELIEDSVNGRKFAPGDAAALQQAALQMLADPGALQMMRIANRLLFEKQYAPAQAIVNLESIYRDVIAQRSTIISPFVALN